MSDQDKTTEWGNKLAELVTQSIETPQPAENIVHARLSDIDGPGIAALVSKLRQETKTYDGFALILQHDTKYKSFDWLQFITRQLVVEDTAKMGNLVTKTNTTSYQLVNSAVEITDFSFASGSKPSNWDTCWKVDSTCFKEPKPFFREAYEYAISQEKKLTAILDAPTPFVGTIPTLDILKKDYQDLPDNLVVMKDAVASHQGVSRAYFSDYLMKENNDGKWHIFARFDFHLTWDPATKDTAKKNFILHSLKSIATTELLQCHKAALLHEVKNEKNDNLTGKKKQPWKDFHDLIVS